MNEDILTENFISDLFREDELGAVIRAHLYVEKYVDELLGLLFPYPKELKPLKLDFDGKLCLIAALGVNSTVKKPLSILGGIRNKFAHRPNYKLDKSQIKNLYSSLGSNDKELLHRVYKGIRKDYSEWQNLPDYNLLEPKEQFVLLAIVIRTIISMVKQEISERNA